MHGSPHDIRRSGATTLVGRYGVSRLVVGMLLGHTAREGAAVTSVYDRHTCMPEKRQAFEHWSRHLIGLETDGDTASQQLHHSPLAAEDNDSAASAMSPDEVIARASNGPSFRQALIEGLLQASLRSQPVSDRSLKA